MSGDLRLVRITRHEVGYVWATPYEVEKAVTGWKDPDLPGVTVVDGDALLSLNFRIPDRNVVASHVTAEVVENDEDGDPVGVEDWHIIPEHPATVTP